VVKKSEERKEEFLNIAIKLFLQKGYENTSVKDVYAEANGSFGMFYHHFKSKEELFGGAMDKFTKLFMDGFSAILCDEKICFEKRYRAAIMRLIEFLNGRDKVCGYERGEIDVSVFRLLSLKILSESIPSVKLYLEEGMKKNAIHTNDVHQAAVFITYGIYGILREGGLRTSSNKNALLLLSKLSDLMAKALDSDPAMFKIEISDTEVKENEGGS